MIPEQFVVDYQRAVQPVVGVGRGPMDSDAAVKYAVRHPENSNEFILSPDDEAFLHAIRSNRGAPGSHKMPLLVLADKLQEEGHEDFAHLLRAGAERGHVSHYVAPVDSMASDWRGITSLRWNHQDSMPRELLDTVAPRTVGWHTQATFYYGPKGHRSLTVRIPTSDPTINQHAVNILGPLTYRDGLDQHWSGMNEEPTGEE